MEAGVARRAQYAEATRRGLLDAAQELFAAEGYVDVSIDEICRSARVTKGALYHHFRDKRDLFRAVFIESENDFVGRVGARVAGIEDPYELLVAALEATLDACTDSELARIAFLDGPAVLGFEDWRSIVDGYSLGLLTAMLLQAMDAGALRRAPVDPLAHLVSGALNEAGMVIATGGDRDEVGRALRALLDGLRA
jgi:AcrR family transcriptional regulator